MNYPALRPEEFRPVWVLPDPPSPAAGRRPDLSQAETSAEEWVTRAELNTLRSESCSYYILGMDAAQLGITLREHLTCVNHRLPALPDANI